MKNAIYVVIVPFMTVILSCNSYAPQRNKHEDSLKTKENDLLRKELEIKQHELELKERELQVNRESNLPVSELYKTVKKGVFIIYLKGQDIMAQGTGFFLSSSGIAVSNYHVFEDADQAVVYLDDGSKYMITKILSYDKDLDYVIFQVGTGQRYFKSLEIATNLPDVGEQCFAIGNPKGLLQTLSIGNISGYRDTNNFIQTTTEITHGSSGGPLFDRSGKVIGITTSGLGEANLNFAVNINRIPYQSYVSQSLQASSSPNTVPHKQIRLLIENYYRTLFEKDYPKLRTFYSEKLDRYYSDFNVAAASAVSDSKDYWVKFHITRANNTISWNTLDIQKMNNNDIEVRFNMDYSIERANTRKTTTFNINIIIILDQQMRITSIYEDILSRS